MTLDWIFGGPVKWFLSRVHSAIVDVVFIQNDGVKKPINIYVAKMFQLYIKPEISKKISL